MVFRSFVPTAYRHSHLHIEPKHGSDKGRVPCVL